MFLNIITPCSRPQNLKSISDSINIPKENYRWIVVFDAQVVPDIYVIDNCEFYAIKDERSSFGNAQRNYAINLINNGYIYFNDDDTIIHPNLWNNIKDIHGVDFITFDQSNKNGSPRLKGGSIKVNHIDSHNFITKYDVCKDLRFIENLYNADGIFAEQSFNNSNNFLIIKETLSIYNYLK